MSKNEMIMLPREVVEQALESLLNEGNFRKLLKPLIEKSIDTLSAALEQPQDHVPDAWNMVPEGWKLVPVGPTVEMMDAGGAATRRCYQHLNKDEVMCSYVYRAMLAAAPQPPALGRPQSNPTNPYLWYDPENGDTWTQEAIDEGFFPTDNLIPLYAK